MAYVKVYYKGDSEEEKATALEIALKSFKRKVEREGVLKELRNREQYTPPSVQKRLKRKEAIKRARRMASKKRRYFHDK